MGKFYPANNGRMILHPFCIRKVFWLKIHLPNLLQWKKKMQISGVKTYKGHCIYQPKQNQKIPHKIYRKLALFHPSQSGCSLMIPKKESYPNKLQHATTKCRVFFFSWCDVVAFLSFSRGFILGYFFCRLQKKMGEPSQVVQFILTVENHNFFGCWNESVWGKKKCRPKSSIHKTFLCISYVVY